MQEAYKTERLSANEAGDVTRAAQLLREGETVAFPTETVYGLGANALDAVAVARVFAAKRRPNWDPLIVHVASRQQLDALCEVPPLAVRLMDAFWPGPLTLLLPRLEVVPDSVTAGRPLVGVRMPAHGIALKLLQQAGIPVAAPSANRFGHTSPTTAAHVLADLDGRIAAVLDGGATAVGLESTVAGLDEHGGVVVYRPGGVTQAMLSEVAGSVTLYAPQPTPGQATSLPSPGVGIRHYAPAGSLLLVEPIEAQVQRAVAAEQAAGARVGVLLPSGWQADADVVYPWGAWEDEAELASRLFAGLRALDAAGCTVLVCPVPQGSGLAAAMRDRLEKAARTG